MNPLSARDWGRALSAWRRALRRVRPGACDACGERARAGESGGTVCAACLAAAERVAREEAAPPHAGEGEHGTLQGFRVRSEGEAAIADHLFKNGVLVQYEPRVGPYRPDFLVPHERLVIEYYGMRSKDYNRRKEKKERWYAENGYRVIGIKRNDVPRLPEILKDLSAAPPGLRAELKRQKKLAGRDQ